MAPALPRWRTTVTFFRLFSCGGPEWPPHSPRWRTTVTFFRLQLRGPRMAPALPPMADSRLGPGGLLDLRPGVPEGDAAVEHRASGRVVFPVRHEVAHPLE